MELLKISNAFKIYSIYLLFLVLNMLSNLKTWPCNTTRSVGAQCCPRQSYMYNCSLESKVICTGACRMSHSLCLLPILRNMSKSRFPDVELYRAELP